MVMGNFFLSPSSLKSCDINTRYKYLKKDVMKGDGVASNWIFSRSDGSYYIFFIGEEKNKNERVQKKKIIDRKVHDI